MANVIESFQNSMRGLSREQAIVCYGVILLIVMIIINSIVKRGKTFKVLVIVGALCLFFFGGEVINLNHLPKGTLEKVNLAKEQLQNTFGDLYIKTEGNSVYVDINGAWVNVDDITVVGEFTKDNVINYDGKDIYLGHSGVYNTIKVLEDVGLLTKGEK